MPTLQNYVRETTATTGNGTINLAGAVSSFAAFSDRYPSGDEVFYTIVDDNGNKESGIGTLTHGTPDTLTRDAAPDAIVGGVIQQTPIILSGSATVTIGPDVSNIDLYPNILSDTSTEIYASGHLSVNSSRTSTTITANRQYVVPFLLNVDLRLTGLVMHVLATNAANPGSVSRIGLCQYRAQSATDLLEDVSIDLTSTGRVISAITARDLTKGWYGIVFASDSAISVLSSSLTQGWNPGGSFNDIYRTEPTSYMGINNITSLPGALTNPETSVPFGVQDFLPNVLMQGVVI